ncbi:MAG: DMT family transporter [Promethearchaeota archaeon]
MYGEIAAILTNICFALSFVLARKIDDEATPIFQNTIRAAVGLLTFSIICLSFGVLLIIFSLSLFLISMLMMSVLCTVIIGDTAYLHSQKILGPAKALAITTTSPFFTIILATIFLNRPFSISMIFSGIFIGLGVIIITQEKTKKINDDTVLSINEQNSGNELKKKIFFSTLNGTFWAIVAAISWAIGIALSDFSINQVNLILNLGILSTIIAMMVRFLFATSVLGMMAIIEGRSRAIPKSRNTWKILIISAILSYSIGSILFGEAVHITGASFMSLISTALPLFTIPFSFLINKEKISKKAFFGVIITLSGVILILI